MHVINEPEAMRRAVAGIKGAGKTLALVPTMGAIHEAHLDLVRRARAEADCIAVSIFVNPTQFNSPEDLTNYPRTLEADLEACRKAGVDLVFVPDPASIYREAGSLVSTAPTALTRVRAGDRSTGLCGATRPGHFDGVVTIVTILFQIIAPDVAIFGEKDFQQLRVIEALVSDLFIPVRIVPAPLVREPDGLAMSSRNRRLSAEDRYSALYIPRTLFKVREVVEQDRIVDAEKIKQLVVENLEKAPDLRIDYVEITDRETLKPLQTIETSAQLLVAAFCGPVRLIDNIQLKPLG